MDRRVLSNLSLLRKRLDICKAIANANRLQILEYLRDGEKCVCDIIPAVDMEQSTVSQHLSVLKNAGILNSRKEGQHVLYKVRNNKVFGVMDAVDALLIVELEEAGELLKDMQIEPGG